MSVCCDKFTVYLCLGGVVCAGVCRSDATVCSWLYAKSENFASSWVKNNLYYFLDLINFNCA